MKNFTFLKKIGNKTVCGVLSLVLILSCVILPLGVTAEISYTEPTDLSEGKLFDFSSNTFICSSGYLIDGSTVTVSDNSTLELQKERRVAGWGWSVKEDGSNKVLRAGKNDKTTYTTSGSLRLNDNNQFYILKPSQAYFVSLRYKVISTHKIFEKNGITYPADTASSTVTMGYGANVGTSVDIGARMGTITTTVATLAKINNNQNTFLAYDENGVETVRNVGQWYEEEYYFTTPETFPSQSQHFALQTTMHNGMDIYIDDVFIKEVPTVALELNGGSGINVKQPAMVGDEIDFGTPTREGYTFGGWYKDRYCTVPFTDKVFTEENNNTTVYAKWDAEFNRYTADFFDYTTGNEITNDLRENVVLNSNTFTSHNLSIVSTGTEDGRKQLFFNGYDAITTLNRAFFPLGNLNGNIKLQSNTTYTMLIDYEMECAMSGSQYKLKLFTASAENADDGAVAHFDEIMPSGAYRHFITFTTGNIQEGKDAAYLEISYKHSNVETVTFKMVKLVKIDDGMNYIRAYNNLENKTYEFLGYTGEKVDLPVFENNDTYTFDGWYTDNGYKELHSGYFGSEKNSFAYALWLNNLVDFENFVPAMENSLYTVGSDIFIGKADDSYAGEKCLKYVYKYAPNYYNGPHNEISMAVVYDKTTYKINFKYKLDKALDNVDIKFFTAHRANCFAYITNYNEATYTIYKSEIGDGWQEAEVYLTTNFVKAQHSDGLFLSFNPLILGETQVCIDDVRLDVVKASKGVVAFLGKDAKSGDIYVQENVGTTVTAPNQTPKARFASFAGWYSDKECTIPFSSTKVKAGITYVYSKWNENCEDFEGYTYDNQKVVKSNNNTAIKNGEAILGRVLNDTTYAVDFSFKTTSAGSKVYFKTALENGENQTVYNDEGSAYIVESGLADGKWHTVRRYINTSFNEKDGVAGDFLFVSCDGEIEVDNIKAEKCDVVFNRGSAVLNNQAAEIENGQAMRFFFGYQSENAATIKVGSEDLTLVERGIVLKNASVKDGGAITLEKAELGTQGYATKNIKYGFGNFWQYTSGEANSKLYAAYSKYPGKVKAALTAESMASLPTVDQNGENFVNMINTSNGYLSRETVSDDGTCLRYYNNLTWSSRGVFVLVDENGSVIQTKPNTTYSVTLTYKAPVNSGTIEIAVNGGLAVANREDLPAGDKTKDTVLALGSADLTTCSDSSYASLGWVYTWLNSGHHRWGATAPSETWQTVTYTFANPADMTGYLPVIVMGINIPAASNGAVSELIVKDITVCEKDCTEFTSTAQRIGETSAGVNNNGVVTPNTLASGAQEGEYFAGWKDANGNFVTADGIKVETGEVVYSYYINKLKENDSRLIGAKGYIKAKDKDGKVYTFFSSEIKTSVSEVASVAAEITDKEVHTIANNNWNRYTIVNPKMMPYIYGIEIENLIDYAADKGVELKRVTEKANTVPYEIIIGDTTRPESSLVSVTGENQYVIAVKGKKLIIKGGSDIATKQALCDLLELLKFKDSLGCGIDLYDGIEIRGEYSEASDKYVLTFNEEFNEIDTNVWKSYAGHAYGYFYGDSVLGGSYGNRSVNDLPVLTKSGETKELVTVRDGNLVLGSAWVIPTAEKDIANNVEFMHANVSTFYTMIYTYGLLEIKSDVADVPSTTSFWINDASSAIDGERNGCMTEYDLIENYGRTNYFASCLHQWSNNMIDGNLDHFGPDSKDYTGNLEQSYKPDFDEESIYDNYHIYSFLWEDERIIFAFDGVKYCEYDIPDWYRENMANCLIISSGLGDASYGAKFEPEKHGDYFETLIDYIRIYQVEDMGSKMIWKS